MISGTFGRQNGKPMVAFDWHGTTSYYCSLVTLGLDGTVGGGNYKPLNSVQP